MSLGLLVAIVIGGIVLVVLTVHRSGGSAQALLDDAGAAIVEFGKAYPALPIRDVVLTADRRAAFLRLADQQTGFVQAHGRHTIARLLQGGAVHVSAGPEARSLAIDFKETTFKGGVFVFASAEDAAEVSLWIIGALIAARDEERLPRGENGDA